MLCSAVRIRARVRRIAQHVVDGGVPWSSPPHLVARGRNRHLQSVFEKPQQCLPCGAKFEELAEYQQHPFLDSEVRILFQTILTLDIPGGRSDDQFATLCLLSPRLHGTLSQQVY